jgi:hypothetical protein
MSYDFDYYSGHMLRVPEKPKKPLLPRNPSAAEARAYADALEEYDRERLGYGEYLGWYNEQKEKLQTAFKNQLRSDWGMGEQEFDFLWDEAYELSHSGGLSEVYCQFDRLKTFADEYTRVMLMKV